MCGIVGILGKTPVALQIVDALKRLEYRGYDSAGVATLEDGGRLERRRAEGKLGNLEVKLSKAPLSGAIGIGHTRWATHGRPNEVNAHPHATEKLAVVHNGIIENFRELKDELRAQGVRFETETDTEVVAQLVTSEMRRGQEPDGGGRRDPAAAARRLRARLPLRRRRGPAHRRPARAAARGRARRGRDVSRLRRRRARPLHRRGHLSRGRRLGRAVAEGRPDPRSRRPPGRAAAPARSGRDLHGREGQPPPFHGEGDLRAARGRRPHARPLRRLHGRQGRAAGPAAVRLQGAEADVDLGLRHRLSTPG